MKNLLNASIIIALVCFVLAIILRLLGTKIIIAPIHLLQITTIFLLFGLNFGVYELLKSREEKKA